ncbi:hypothetical protein D6779_05290 [Candidatus Parcubacteria bacterium]|nr:MAG: hypothetical protein D6779_05290 [Candidatus Parcubacteria bacterium]
MAKMIVDLSGECWTHDDWFLEWSDPEEGMIEIPFTGDEARWISQGLRKAKRLNDLIRDHELGVEHNHLDVWVPLPETVREKLAQAGLPDPDSLVLSAEGLLARVANEALVKEWQESKVTGLPSLQSERQISKAENEAFDEMVHTHLQSERIKPENVKAFLALMWEKSHPDDRAFMGLPAEQRVSWSMRWLSKLVKLNRISRALAFRTLEMIS